MVKSGELNDNSPQAEYDGLCRPGMDRMDRMNENDTPDLPDLHNQSTNTEIREPFYKTKNQGSNDNLNRSYNVHSRKKSFTQGTKTKK